MTSKSDDVSSTASEQTNIDAIADAVAKKLEDDEAEYVEDKTPEFVWDQFEQHWKSSDKALSGLQPHRSAWTQFTEWMDEQGYEYLTDLDPTFPARHDDWIVSHEEYDKTKLSRSFHLTRIKMVIQHADSRGWIDPNVVPDDNEWDRIKPDLENEDKIRSDPLPPERGEEIMAWVAENRPYSRAHVLWILLFRYGFRVSAIRALDRDDLILEEPDDWPEDQPFRPHLRLKDRPHLGPDDDPGLPLKNKRDELSSRRVPLQPEDAEVIRRYVDTGSPHGAKNSRKEFDEPDEYGLYGLLTGEHNPRLSGRTIRERTKWLTCPTTYGSDCQCDGCRDYRAGNDGDNPMPSKRGKYCEESRSPHQVRHGAITRMLDNYDHSTVARIVGTSPDTLRNVYDRANDIRRLNRTASAWLQ